MPTLPIELIVEILSRLPVKTLLKFRCVSKSWLALIRSPEFVKTHLNVSAKNKDYTHHRLVLTETINLLSSFNIQYILRDCSISSLRNDSVIEASDLNYPMKNQQQSVCVVGSVNGLICLAIKDTDLVLWNPSIRLFKNLPDSGPSVTGDYHFDSSIYGFGYDESNDDYKVVGVLWNRYKLWHPVEVKIYSLKSNSWRSMDDIPDGLRLGKQCKDGLRLVKPCKFVNGKLHWAGELHWANSINGPFRKGWNIISFDLADEKWGKVELPRYGGEGDFSLKLDVLRSDLSVMFCSYMTSQADLWVMREYGVKESWTKKYTINLCYGYSPFTSQTLCMSNKGDILFVPGSTLTVHNPEDEPIRYPKFTNIGSCAAVDIYIESLVCAPLYRTNRSQQERKLQKL